MVGYSSQSQWVVANHNRSGQTPPGTKNLAAQNPQQRVVIRRNQFDSIDDVPRIKRELHAGHIVFLDAHDALCGENADYLELKRAIEQLRAFCNLTGGTIGRVGQDLLVITPNPKVRL